MEFDHRHHPPGYRPTRRLIAKTFEPKHGLVARPSHWPGQQLRNLPLQMVVGGKADRILHFARFQHLVELRLGKGGVATEGHVSALRLLLVDLRQQEFLPAARAVDVAGTQLGGQAVALAVKVKQQQRMITGGLEVAVVRAVLLPAMDPHFGAVHVQHYSPRVKRWPLPWQSTLC
jgi:hypothetical protein